MLMGYLLFPLLLYNLNPFLENEKLKLLQPYLQFEDYTLYQLDRDGKLAAKRTIPDEEKIFSIMHGDSSRMFMFSFVNNKIVYIDKSNIEKGDIKELR